MVRVEILEQPISLDRSLGSSGRRNGAIVEFQGVVRGIENGAPIEAIDYECHQEMAIVQLRMIAEEMKATHGLAELIVLHRVGRVPVGETSLYVRAVAEHREAALDATEALIARLKIDVPIWKHPLPGEA